MCELGLEGWVLWVSDWRHISRETKCHRFANFTPPGEQLANAAAAAESSSLDCVFWALNQLLGSPPHVASDFLGIHQVLLRQVSKHICSVATSCWPAAFLNACFVLPGSSFRLHYYIYIAYNSTICHSLSVSVEFKVSWSTDNILRPSTQPHLHWIIVGHLHVHRNGRYDQVI